mmetsp:Transcript_25004/g.54581  ORF Transcript_25004/g.54581 Transcript_25004/m.54581 type:complete len:363 (+) Transcript_25004:53-1141(+)
MQQHYAFRAVSPALLVCNFLLSVCKPFARHTLGPGHNRSLIVSGEEAEPYKYPFVTAVFRHHINGRVDLVCGGTLLSATWVLTAAHCTVSQLPLSVGIHRHDIGRPAEDDHPNCSEDIEVVEVIMHEEYTIDSYDYDLALLRLARGAACGASTSRVRLHDSSQLDVVGLTALVAGWGILDSGDTQYPDSLQIVDVEIFSVEQCRTLLGTDYTELQLCARGDPDGDACVGDSGGPLFYDSGDPNDVPVLVGVVAWGQGCDDPLYPGAYTRIGSFNQWIEARTVDTLSSPPSPLPSPPPPMWPVRSPPPPSYTQAEACRCTTTYTSGAALVDFNGCAEHLDDVAFCYVIAPLQCARATPSTRQI